jgi:hypothetical protein
LQKLQHAAGKSSDFARVRYFRGKENAKVPETIALVPG